MNGDIMRRTAFSFVACVCVPALCPADNNVRPWEASGFWPQSAALAYANTAQATDPESLFYNPAGMSQQAGPAILYSHRPWATDPDDDSFAIAAPWGPSLGFGAGVESQRAGGSYSSTRVIAATARRFGRASLGLGLRDWDLLWGRSSAQLISADLGLLWQGAWLGSPLHVGASALELPLANNSTYSRAHQISLGASLPLKSATLSLDAKASAGSASVQGGLELPLFNFLLLRGGVSSAGYQGAAVAASGGLGLRYGDNFSFDYAVCPAGNAGILHCFSLGLRFSEGWDGFVDPTERQRLAQERERQRKIEALHLEAAHARASAKAEARQSGAFEIEAKVMGRQVTLRWDALPDAVEGRRYEVYMGLLANAKFHKLSEEASVDRAWSGEMSLRGVTYYFQVRATEADGSPGPLSKVKAVNIP